MADFVEAYSKTTGKAQIVPAHYLENPAFGFTKAPNVKTRESAAPATQETEKTPAKPEKEASSGSTR